MSISCGVAILAAGEGSRLKLSVAKALAPILGKALIDFPIAAAEEFAINVGVDYSIGVVTGFLRADVESYLNTNASKRKAPIAFAFQERQLGTADAVKAYFRDVDGADKQDYTLIMCADTPLLEASDLEKVFNILKNDSTIDAVAATFRAENPYGYGRIVKSKQGFHIVEEKDANDEIKKINEVNSGMYIFKTDFILKHIHSIASNNKSAEFYLTDLFQNDRNVRSCLFENPEAFLGINTLEQLENAGKILRDRKISLLRNSGVRFIDSTNVYIDWDVQIGSGSLIHPNIYIYCNTILGSKVTVEPGTVIKSSNIEDNVCIYANSYVEGAVVGTGVKVGPFARLRPGADIGPNCKIGNFVEIKKAKLEHDVKVSHLSYIGDASIGEETNVGCGFITCNYDGVRKHITTIGKRVFVGSDCQIVAPVTIGDDSLIAAGTTVTFNVEAGDLAIARKRQENKPGLAKKLRG